MRIVTYDEVRSVATPAAVVEAVRASFVAQAAGRIRQALTSHLAFHDADRRIIGDCHVKWGHAESSDFFVVKIATGFYGNPQHGLPASNGLMLLISARTGEPAVLLEDRGWLTDARTAAAGVLAVEAAGVDRVGTVGVLGSGTQADLQARWIAAHMSVGRVLIWGRREEAVLWLVAGLRRDGIDAAAARSASDVAAQSDVIVTTTPSREPLLFSDDVRNGTVLVAVGADAFGKRELDPALLGRAERIVCDDPVQCLEHGELQTSGIDIGRLELLGELLSRPRAKRPSRALGITVVDLTGIAAQDVVAAQACWALISRRTRAAGGLPVDRARLALDSRVGIGHDALRHN